ncbi:flagellar hook-length control protein FliK [Photobacterium carnosum]|uniref:flagellar hook-length control protein FliK n=1 Tax=Photobacterium carnosum TaxID=2023717 RepID=UPI001E325221|nr:flagellar hook-length control protein FliK [Photobacterium carnosum]
MNLFNVSFASSAKPVAVGSVSSTPSEMVTLSNGEFSEQYQQAIDEIPTLQTIDSKTNPAATNVPDTIDVDTEALADDSTIDDSTIDDSTIDDVAIDKSLMSADGSVIAIDDAVELITAGNVFLQQLMQSNQQLNSSYKTATNSDNGLPSSAIPTIDAVVTEDVLLSAQPTIKTIDGSAAFIMPATAGSATTTAILTSSATKVTDNADGQKSDADGDVNLITNDGVNNSPLLTSARPLSATTSNSEMLINPSMVDSSLLLNDDNRSSHQGINSNAQGDSLAQQLAGLTPTSTTSMLKPEQPLITQSIQSPLVLTREQAGEEVHERINMMMAKNLKYVDIRLDPPELGKLHIKLSINQDQASVQFTVNNHQTRDIVEQAMPRLREMLQQQGLQLAQSSVQQDNSQQSSGHQSNNSTHSQSHSGQSSSLRVMSEDGSSLTESDPGDLPISMLVTKHKDQVDYYA